MSLQAGLLSLCKEEEKKKKKDASPHHLLVWFSRRIELALSNQEMIFFFEALIGGDNL